MVDEMVETEKLVEVSKPVFYGFMFVAAVTMTVAPSFAGTLMGVAMMSAISFVSASLSDMFEDDWGRFMKILSVLTLLGSVLSGAFLASMLAF